MIIQTHGRLRSRIWEGKEPPPQDPVVEVPYDDSAVMRAVAAVQIHRRENVRVHGLSCGFQAFASLLAYTVASDHRTRDFDHLHLSAFGCTAVPVFLGVPLMLDVAAEWSRVGVLVAFEVAALSPEARERLREGLLRVALAPA